MRMLFRSVVLLGVLLGGISTVRSQSSIGQEIAIARHLADGEEFTIPLHQLLAHGQRLFRAVWTVQEGGGRPLTKGVGAPLSDLTSPLEFPHNFNRLSAPDANSCAGCHNLPFGIAGGGGDIVANVFVLGHRFDFVTFDPADAVATRGDTDEVGSPVRLQTLANSRATIGMFGSGYIEMLARQMTRDLQATRDAVVPGRAQGLVSKGISFGVLARDGGGAWDVSLVQGLPAPSLDTGPLHNLPPSLVIRPFHQAGAVVSLRQFSNNAFNHHHGIQSEERFGLNVDADGDGFVNELTRADVTAVTLFQAAMAVPGRVIPDDRDIEAAILIGEARFRTVGCTTCHVPSLPLDRQGWVFTEPNPFNPPGNLRTSDGVRTMALDLQRDDLPQPRLHAFNGVVMVPAFTDLKLHDITSGPGDPNIEPLDMNQPTGSPEFFAGNSKFITRRLWGSANEPPFFHHGLFTTLRQAVLAHAGEALAARTAFAALSAHEQDAVIEFLKTLQVLPPGTTALVVNEQGKSRRWPPR